MPRGASRVLPHAVEQIDANRLAITIGEGKYHQVKRMLAAAGNHCSALRRTAIGGLTLDALLVTINGGQEQQV